MNGKTILIADDESRIRRMLSDFLRGCGYNIMEAKDGEEVLNIFYANNSKIDCLILDIMMPNVDGLEVLKEIRDCSLVPIIMLTAKGEEYDQLAGFKSGADDYIGKPFSLTLLLARLEAVLKRCSRLNGDIIEIGKIKIDEMKKQASINSKNVNLTPKEYELLSYLAINPGVTLSREQILNSVWNYDYCGDLRTVDTHVKQLRAKIGICGKYIKTIYGFGYRMEIDENEK